MSWKKELEKLHLFDYENFSDEHKMDRLESFIEKTIKQEKIKLLEGIISEDESGKFVLQMDFLQELTNLKDE